MDGGGVPVPDAGTEFALLDRESDVKIEGDVMDIFRDREKSCES